MSQSRYLLERRFSIYYRSLALSFWETHRTLEMPLEITDYSDSPGRARPNQVPTAGAFSRACPQLSVSSLCRIRLRGNAIPLTPFFKHLREAEYLQLVGAEGRP